MPTADSRIISLVDQVGLPGRVVASPSGAVNNVVGGELATPGRVDVLELDASPELADMGDFIDHSMAFRRLGLEGLVAAGDANRYPW